MNVVWLVTHLMSKLQADGVRMFYVEYVLSCIKVFPGCAQLLYLGYTEILKVIFSTVVSDTY